MHSCGRWLVLLLATLITTNSLTAQVLAATQKATIINPAAKDRKAEADGLLEEGRSLRFKEVLKSRKILEKALSIYRQISDRDGEEDTLYELGDLYFELEKSPYPRATNFYRQALAIAQEEASSRKAFFGDWTKKRPLSGSCEYEDSIHPKLYRSSKRYVKEYQANLTLGQQEEAFQTFRQVFPLVKQSSFLGQLYSKIMADNAPSVFAGLRTNKISIEELSSIDDTLQDEYYAIGLQYWFIPIRDYKKINNYIPINLNSKLIEDISQNNYLKILEFSEQLIDFYQKDKNYHGEFSNRADLVSVYKHLGKEIQAASSARRMLEMARQLGSCSDELHALRVNHLVHIDRRDYQNAIKYAQQQLFLAQKLKYRLGEPSLAAEALQKIGDAYLELGNYSAAIHSYKQQFSVMQETVEKPSTFPNGFLYFHENNLDYKALSKLSEIHLKIGEKEKAVAFAEQSVELATTRKKCDQEVESRERLANLNFYLGNYAKAIDQAERSLKIIYRDSESCVKEYATPLGEFARSVTSSDGSIKIEIPRKDFAKPDAISTLILIANSYGRLGNYVKMHSYAQQALAEAKKTQDLSEQLGPLTLLINIYQAANPEKAIEYSSQLLLVAQKVKNFSAEISALQAMGFLHLRLGYLEKGKQYLQQVLVKTRQVKDQNSEIQILQMLGLTSSFWGSLSEGQEYFQEALTLLKEKGQTPDPSFKKNLGVLYMQLGDYSKSIEYLEQSIADSQHTDSSRNRSDKLTQLGYALWLAGKPEEAEKRLFTAIQLLESLRTGLQDSDYRSLFETQRDPYLLLQQILVKQNKIEQALEIAERSRARAFVTLLASKIQPNKMVNNNGEATRQARNQTTPGSISKSYNYPSFQEIKRIARLQNTTIVQYSIVSDQDLYIWVIQPNGNIFFRLSSLAKLKSSLSQLVSDTRRAIGVRSRSSIEVEPIESNNLLTPETQAHALQTLHLLLIEPIAGLLPDEPSQRVIFVPQGELFLVPFVALKDANGRYLIEKHTILTAPAIQALELTHSLKQARKPVSNRRNPTVDRLSSPALIVGNPTMPKVSIRLGDLPKQLTSLVGAEVEAVEIAKVFGVKALIGNQATKKDVVRGMRSSRIIHLATHGLLDTFQGEIPGAIALAPSNKSSTDGLLTAEEILNTKLEKADLVVLSACDTGKGDITGDGVVGLSRTLFIAGAPSVIVSLWSVPDAPTAELMVEFYRNWRDRKMDKAQALRQAMLTTIKTHPNPRDWAAFTLIGEAE